MLRQKLILALTRTKIWSWVILKIVPYLRFSLYYTRFDGEEYAKGYSILTPGQFLLCLDEKKLTAFLVPGFMTHAAYCVGNSLYSQKSTPEIVEMTHEHYHKTSFFNVCKESSRILICDCDDWDADHKSKMLSMVSRLQDAKYDVSFQFGIDSLYCSELVYQLDRMAANPDCTLEELKTSTLRGLMLADISDFAGLNQDYIPPDGLLFSKNCRVVWDSDNELTGMRGPEAEEFCRQKKYIK